MEYFLVPPLNLIKGFLFNMISWARNSGGEPQRLAFILGEIKDHMHQFHIHRSTMLSSIFWQIKE